MAADHGLHNAVDTCRFKCKIDISGLVHVCLIRTFHKSHFADMSRFSKGIMICFEHRAAVQPLQKL
jgi:hypothetical protein